jgi:hypothetical protein
VTFGSHVTTTKRKARGKAGHAEKHSQGTIAKKKAREKAGHAQNLLPVRTTSGHVLFRSRDFVTFGQKAPQGRIWRHFLLRMRRTYFRTGHVTDVTSGHVTSGSTTAQHHRKYDLSCTHILLTRQLENRQVTRTRQYTSSHIKRT